MRYLLFTIALGIALAFIGDLADTIAAPYKKPEHIYCAGGTLTCPDGSQVWRYPPTCDFAACPKDDRGDF